MELPADGDTVFVPARPVRVGSERDPAVEIRRLAGSGEPVGLAFTSAGALVRTLGPFQPWLGMPMYAYVAWLRTQGVDRVQVDPVYAADVHGWDAATVVAASEEG
ncbi:SAV_915 family protein [Actinoplanes sp. NPDC026619]|uniref:SAV_915 family protein n=1 Tax=Actinoplanes sp. NPDC026619 TaxID=3155798 RepID=UPI0033D6AF44